MIKDEIRRLLSKDNLMKIYTTFRGTKIIVGSNNLVKKLDASSELTHEYYTQLIILIESWLIIQTNDKSSNKIILELAC